MRHENVNVNVMNATTSDRDQAFESLIDIIDGTRQATPGDMRTLLGSEEGGKAWADLRDIGEAIGRKSGVAPNKEKAWTVVAGRMGGRRRKSLIVRIGATVAAAAAAIALLLTVVVPKQETAQPVARQKIVARKTGRPLVAVSKATAEKAAQEAAKPTVLTIGTQAREMRHAVLADGTEVWLNSLSSLTYPEKFVGGERSVRLRGEAYFKVAHDAARPFVITTAHLRTKVLGTEFNVRSYSRDDAHVTLVEGKVEVSAGGSVVRISPSEDATIEDGGLRVSHVNTKDFTSWRHGIMYFDNASLRTILQEMGSWYGVNVICNDNGLLDRRFHFMYNRNAPVEEALRLLNDASDVNVAFEHGDIVIK